MRNALPKGGPKTDEAAVVNLDVQSGDGTHWVAYRKSGNRVFYFDSYGDLKPPKELLKYFKDTQIIYNHDNYQKDNQYNCGHLCIKFLLQTGNGSYV